jgi:hypothetical protein
VTSDGIETADWEKVHELAVAIANCSEDKSADADEFGRTRGRLFSLLDELEGKYGARPSLLATRADYVDSSVERERHLRRAYDAARELDDVKNLVWVASSLASYYMEEASDLDEGAQWLGALREHLLISPDEHEEAEVQRLEELLLKGS